MKVQEYMHRAGVGLKFLSADLNDRDFFLKAELVPQAVERYVKLYKIAKKIVQDGEVGVFIEGSPGSGKSFLGAAILREYLRNKKKAARATMDEIKDFYYDGFQGIRDRYSQADVLLIEDITSTGVGSPQYAQVLEKLIKIRDDENLITCYSALPGGVSKKYPENVVRIIKGSCITLQLPDIDLRQLKLKKYAEELK